MHLQLQTMSMAAITLGYTPCESVVKTILADVDIILMPEDFIASYRGIYDAVKSGIISERRINESVLRILNLKDKYHLL